MRLSIYNTVNSLANHSMYEELRAELEERKYALTAQYNSLNEKLRDLGTTIKDMSEGDRKDFLTKAHKDISRTLTRLSGIIKAFKLHRKFDGNPTSDSLGSVTKKLNEITVKLTHLLSLDNMSDEEKAVCTSEATSTLLTPHATITTPLPVKPQSEISGITGGITVENEATEGLGLLTSDLERQIIQIEGNGGAKLSMLTQIATNKTMFISLVEELLDVCGEQGGLLEETLLQSHYNSVEPPSDEVETKKEDQSESVSNNTMS